MRNCIHCLSRANGAPGEHCAGQPFTLLSDEEAVGANPDLDRDRFSTLPGRISQQIVKSEFWRLRLSETYVCLDSDCYFLRPFQSADFLAPGGLPYTVMHEAKNSSTLQRCPG